MDIKEIIKTYGKNDYYEMQTGRIFQLSKMEYHLYSNETWIPVLENGKVIGCIKEKGNLTL